jgi:L-threonylcarbamoyladenylate synthase
MVTDDDIARAAGLLRAGEVVAFPTETVYGLGADAANPSAVARIYALKGRPSTHPVIVHLAEAAQLSAWVLDVPERAARLAARFWPGPLTMIFRRAARVPDAVTGGQDSVAIRVPAHPVAQALLRAFGGGIAAPSANRFGRVSATTAAHVRSEFGDAVPFILDGGECEVGIESTIVDIRSGQPVLLRPGGVSLADLRAVVHDEIALPGAAAPRAPGTLKAHYAPGTPLVLVAAEVAPGAIRDLVAQGRRLAVLSFSRAAPSLPGLEWRIAPGAPEGYAHELYAHLRALDAAGADIIVVERPPDRPEWFAVLDRLTRAAAGSSGDDDEP